jgi:hypothetical protein
MCVFICRRMGSMRRSVGRAEKSRSRRHGAGGHVSGRSRAIPVAAAQARPPSVRYRAMTSVLPTPSAAEPPSHRESAAGEHDPRPHALNGTIRFAVPVRDGRRRVRWTASCPFGAPPLGPRPDRRRLSPDGAMKPAAALHDEGGNRWMSRSSRTAGGTLMPLGGPMPA